MTSLVTGANGFIGSWMVDYLKSRGDEVVAANRGNCDVTDAAQIRNLLAAHKPDEVYHFAAQSLPGRSWDNSAETCRVNITGTLNVLDAVRHECPAAAVVVACSSSEYAASNDPIPESGAMNPLSPYAVSKLAADHAARLYAERYGLRIIRARPFFLIGPRKTGDVSSDIARRIVAIEQGHQRALPVGRTDVVRDFLDVRDGVKAFAAIAEKGELGAAYNIASGQGTSICDLVSLFCSKARVPVSIQPDPSLMRPLDEAKKVGAIRAIVALGWRPEISLESSVEAILEFWRCKS